MKGLWLIPALIFVTWQAYKGFSAYGKLRNSPQSVLNLSSSDPVFLVEPVSLDTDLPMAQIDEKQVEVVVAERLDFDLEPEDQEDVAEASERDLIEAHEHWEKNFLAEINENYHYVLTPEIEQEMNEFIEEASHY